MEISELYRLYRKHPRVITDSRKDVGEAIFFALKGEHFDGNEFACRALEKGARYAVVDDPELAGKPGCLYVPDSLEALQGLAANHRKQLSFPLVAITGSNGKTTTRELLSVILQTQFRVGSTGGNLNNHIGVPLTLLGMEPDLEIGLLELGANHPGEIDLLCRISAPDHGLVTNIGRAHLEGFGSLEGVKKAKGELYRYLEETGGRIFCNAGDPVLLGLLSGTKKGILYYGEGGETLCSGEVVAADPFLTVKIRIKDSGDWQLTTALTGTYNLENILAAVAVGNYFGIRPRNIVRALKSWSPVENRSQRIDTGRNILIMDAYNANPTSMIAALESFRGQEGDKVLILGDMLELGENGEQAHREVLDYCLDLQCGEVILVGSVFSGLKKPGGVKAFASVEALDRWLTEHPLAGRLILLKGSRGIGLERVKGRL